MDLYKHQIEALVRTADFNKVAYYHDMGLGKTFTGSEKMRELGAPVNLVICQKSKINDWIEHFKTYYKGDKICTFDLTDKDDFKMFFRPIIAGDWFNRKIGVINYDLVYRRPELLKLTGFTLLLDESSLIQNETTKRAKFIMKMNYTNLILLSGTPTSGKYENLFSQLSMLGYKIRKQAFYNMYINYHFETFGDYKDKPVNVMVVDEYKNVERLKRKMRQLGCDFLKTNEVMELPKQQFIRVRVPVSKEYKKFSKTKLVNVDDIILKGDNVLVDLLCLRKLSGAYSEEKLQAFTDLLNSTNDGFIVFYNFEIELIKLLQLARDANRPVSIINGSCKDLTAFNENDNAIVFVQYQAGAMGLNLQKYNKIIYFTPPLSSELYEQSKKRIHRIGQNETCFYYQLVCIGSVEPDIYATLAMRKNYTDELFKQNYTQYFV